MTGVQTCALPISLEAVRRGCDEIWIAWCIGNTPRWGNGPLEQYVHMIELSANGSLFEDFDRLAAMPSPPTVHVIRPTYPLPLDPDYYLGRISTETLIAQGYRDACSYLRGPGEIAGTPMDETATVMRDRPTGIRVHGSYGLEVPEVDAPGDVVRLDGARLEIDIEIDDLDAFTGEPEAGCSLAGLIVVDGVPAALLRAGSFRMVRGDNSRQFAARATFGPVAEPFTLDVTGVWHDDPGLDLWDDLTRVEIAVRDRDEKVLLTGRGSLGLRGLRRLVTSAEPTGVHDLEDRSHVIARGLAFLVGTLRDRAESTGG